MQTKETQVVWPQTPQTIAALVAYLHKTIPPAVPASTLLFFPVGTASFSQAKQQRKGPKP